MDQYIFFEFLSDDFLEITFTTVNEFILLVLVLKNWCKKLIISGFFFKIDF